MNAYEYGLPNPCKDCTERYLACHDTCEKYVNWAKGREQRRADINEKKRFDVEYDRFKVKSVRESKQKAKNARRRKKL